MYSILHVLGDADAPTGVAVLQNTWNKSKGQIRHPFIHKIPAIINSSKSTRVPAPKQ